jgi:hypothetical protein
MLTLFGMPSGDYRRFMNFLAAHECSVAVKEYRREATAADAEAEVLPPFVGANTSSSGTAATAH